MKKPVKSGGTMKARLIDYTMDDILPKGNPVLSEKELRYFSEDTYDEGLSDYVNYYSQIKEWSDC